MKAFFFAFLLAFLSILCAATPAEQAIAQARSLIQQTPDQTVSYTELARALVRRHRETADAAYLRQAEETLKETFRRDPDDFEGQKVKVMILLARHEYEPALDLARKLNKRIPDDVPAYGLVSEASMELGNYQEAETSAQWMLDLRRGNLGGMVRGALLREVFGDVPGALDWLTSVFKLTSATQVEERAWLLTHIARLQLSQGKLEIADKELNQALAMFPGYSFTLRQLAAVRCEQKKDAEAAELLRRVVRIDPHPSNLFALAVALRRAGNEAEAARTFAAFERKAKEISGQPDNANRELILYYADYAAKPAESLRVARREAARRQDVYTLDALAWALYVNGRYPEARAEMDKALKVGIKDPKLLEHAAAIAAKLKS